MLASTSIIDDEPTVNAGMSRGTSSHSFQISVWARSVRVTLSVIKFSSEDYFDDRHLVWPQRVFSSIALPCRCIHFSEAWWWEAVDECSEWHTTPHIERLGTLLVHQLDLFIHWQSAETHVKFSNVRSCQAGIRSLDWRKAWLNRKGNRSELIVTQTGGIDDRTESDCWRWSDTKRNRVNQPLSKDTSQ